VRDQFWLTRDGGKLTEEMRADLAARIAALGGQQS